MFEQRAQTVCNCLKQSIACDTFRLCYVRGVWRLRCDGYVRDVVRYRLCVWPPWYAMSNRQSHSTVSEWFKNHPNRSEQMREKDRLRWGLSAPKRIPISMPFAEINGLPTCRKNVMFMLLIKRSIGCICCAVECSGLYPSVHNTHPLPPTICIPHDTVK